MNDDPWFDWPDEKVLEYAKSLPLGIPIVHIYLGGSAEHQQRIATCDLKTGAVTRKPLEKSLNNVGRFFC